MKYACGLLHHSCVKMLKSWGFFAFTLWNVVAKVTDQKVLDSFYLGSKCPWHPGLTPCSFSFWNSWCLVKEKRDKHFQRIHHPKVWLFPDQPWIPWGESQWLRSKAQCCSLDLRAGQGESRSAQHTGRNQSWGVLAKKVGFNWSRTGASAWDIMSLSL